jgi:hypothetical protein
MRVRQKVAPSLSEQEIHVAVVRHLRMRGVPDMLFFHVPNGGSRRPIEGAIFQSLGVLPGVADLLLFHAGRFFALELKRRGGHPSRQQLAFTAAFQDAGGYAAICDDLDPAIRTLEAWGLLRGAAA